MLYDSKRVIEVSDLRGEHTIRVRAITLTSHVCAVWRSTV